MKRPIKNNTKKWITLCCIFVVMIVVFGTPDEAYAQNCNAQNVQQAVQQCQNYVVENRIFTPIVYCMQCVVNSVAQGYLQQLVTALSSSVTTLMAIAIAVLGIRVVYGASRVPHAETFLLIIKMTIVGYLVFTIGVQTFIDILNDFTAALTTVFTNVLNIPDPYIHTGDVVDPNDPGQTIQATISIPGGVALWHRVDFLFQRILGLGGNDTNMLQGMIGIAMILAGMINLGPIGGWIGTIIFFAIATLIGAFAMVIFSYISAMIAVMILGAFSPLVIPLVLFNNTRNIFEKWLTQLISYSMQPVILTAFLMFMLSIMENSGPVDMITKYKDAYQEISGPNSKSAITMFAGAVTQKKSDVQGLEERDSFNEFVTRFVPGVGDVTETVTSTTTGLSNARVEGPFLPWDLKDTNEYAINLILTIFIAYIILSFVHQLPSLVTDLIGDRTVPNLVNRFGRPVFGAVMKAQEGVTNYLRQ